MIDEILSAKRQFFRRNFGKTPRIMINPDLFRELRHQKDDRGVHFAYFDWKSGKWDFLGMKVVEDIDVERWEIF